VKEHKKLLKSTFIDNQAIPKFESSQNEIISPEEKKDQMYFPSLTTTQKNNMLVR
jgi:hypothetical protein